MIFIDSSDKVEKFNEDIQNELKYSNSFITVDTEFIRENNPLPILCLIQISTSSCVYLIDPLKVPISFLQFCLSNKSLKKVFHSSEQDIEILVNNGLTINNIYDTQLYEMLLNTKENVSYHDIVYRYLGKSLRKSYVLSNWLNRPLSYKQITYAMNDVVYLRQVFIKQQKKLRDLNRENWLDDEIIDMYNSLSKIEKLQNSIDKDNIPIMKLLLEWRYNKSQELKLNLENIIKDDLIKNICRKGADFIHNLQHSRNIHDSVMKEFIYFADSISEQIIIKEPREYNAEIEILKTLLRVKSEEYQICPKIIAKTKDLFNFLCGNFNDVKFLQGWRYNIFGKFAFALMNGEIYLGIDNNKVKLYEE